MDDSANPAVQDGFIDFYQQLGEASTASSDQLRARIDALYSEANANRDHRNPNKRREYQQLLEEILPQARTLLLDETKRARYDAFAAQVKAGEATESFPAFLAGMSAPTIAAERAGILGVQQTAKEVPTSTRKKAPSSRAKKSLQGSLISVAVFFGVMVVMHLVIGLDVLKSIGAGAIVAIIVWIATHFGQGNKISG